MKLALFQSVPETIMYCLMVLLLLFNVGGDLEVLTIIQHHSQTLQTVNMDTQLIEKQQLCIASFFLQDNRSSITLSNLKACQPIVKAVE